MERINREIVFDVNTIDAAFIERYFEENKERIQKILQDAINSTAVD